MATEKQGRMIFSRNLMEYTLWEPPTRLESAEDSRTVLLYELTNGESSASGWEGV